MSSNIEHYVGRQAAWHNLGTVTGKYQTTAELLADPGFQYRVFKSQLHDGLGRPVNAWGTFRLNRADQLAGNKDGAIFLGTVGENYSVIQHAEGFHTIDVLMQSVNGAHYETAGVLGQGEKVWALASLGLGYNIGDDVHKTYILVVTGHDGSMSYTLALCDERAVCANTIKIALSEKGLRSTIRHTKNATNKMLVARDMLASVQGQVTTLSQRMNILASKRLTRDAMVSVLDRLFPKSQNDDGVAQDTTRRTNIVADVLRIYELNDGNQFPEQRGTPYNLLNAVTNYVDHERSSKQDGRAESALFGSGDTLKSRALDMILITAGGLEDMAPRMPVRSLTAGLNGLLALMN